MTPGHHIVLHTLILILDGDINYKNKCEIKFTGKQFKQTSLAVKISNPEVNIIQNLMFLTRISVSYMLL